MTTDSNIVQEQVALFTKLIDEDIKARAKTTERRKKIRTIGAELLRYSGETFDGERNVWYLGPDVGNDKIIFLTGAQANLPLDQMTRDGKRSSLRRKRAPRKVAP